MKHLSLVCFLLLLLIPITTSHATPDNDDNSTSSGGGTSIIFSTVERLGYAFDIFSLPTQSSNFHETKITDGRSVNFNGHFPSPSSSSSSSSLLTLLRNKTLLQTVDRSESDTPPLKLIYVSERNGVSNIYYDELYYDDTRTRERSAIEVVPDRVQIPLLDLEGRQKRISMKDRPSLAGDYLVYVSTHEDPGIARRSSAAVYSTELKSGVSRRLTPYHVADFSPSVSPSGKWTAVASYGERGWDGEIEELSTDIYVFLTRDGTRRVKVIEHGGWPCWGDETTLYFHRRGEDQWWSIYRAILPSHGPISGTHSVVIERVTPPGLHVFTPATSPGNKNFIAVATRRPTSEFRHIELFDLEKNEFKELTRLVSPQAHHYNPFISPDSTRVGYHRCRESSKGSTKLLLQSLPSPDPDISLFRFDGDFPAVSPEGDRIAYSNIASVYIVDLNGQNQRQLYDGFAFSTVWDPVRKGVIYSSAGLAFASVGSEVDIISINVDDDDDQTRIKRLTNGQNNAFPSPSPDGKWIVFRSGRSGYKNLYIMDADGEKSGLRRLTNGPWSDTMPSWSPEGEWIAFSSDRDNPDSGGFEPYIIHPNGTGLRKVFQSGSGGRTNHQWFGPDGKSIVFTSDYAGISAEPISYPHHFQPYGEIFTVKLDGSDLRRFTHNPYEDGTPTWVPKRIKAVDVVWPEDMTLCNFADCHFLNNMPSHGSEAKTKVDVPNMAQSCGLF